MTTPFLPSNGTEGADFMDLWCGRCVRDKVMNGTMYFDDATDADLCPILAASYRGAVAEWIEDVTGPRCTAFVPDTEHAQEVDTRTMDLFGDDGHA